MKSRHRDRKNSSSFIQRRRILRGLTASVFMAPLDPISILVRGLADGFISKAYAQAAPTPVPPKNLLQIGLFGAPPRWIWDLPLSPYRNQIQDPGNDQVVTRFDGLGGSYNQARYQTTFEKGIHLPWVWGQPIMTRGGQTKKMSDALLGNMLNIRGIVHQNDGHAVCHAAMMRPDVSLPSVDGLIADRSSALIPSVMLLYQREMEMMFSSSKGIPIVRSEEATSASLSQILSPFLRSGTNPYKTAPLVDRRKAMSAAVAQGLRLIGDAMSIDQPGMGSLTETYSRAEEYLQNGIGEFASYFDSRVGVYRELIKRTALDRSAVGISDQRISMSIQDDPRNRRFWRSPFVGTYTQNGASKTGRVFFAGEDAGLDMRTLLSADTTIPGLAEAFTIAEFLIKRKLSSTVSLMAGAAMGPFNFAPFSGSLWGSDPSTETADPFLTGMAGSFAAQMKGNAQVFQPYPHDEHMSAGFGRNFSLLMNLFYYRALSSCIFEFITELGPELFDETVIHVTSEYSRAPQNCGMGSEHEPKAAVSTIFGGSIRNPLVIGNTQISPHKSTYRMNAVASDRLQYPGHFGTGDQTTLLGFNLEQGIPPACLASTLAELCRVPSATSNFPSAVRLDQGQVVSNASEPAKERG